MNESALNIRLVKMARLVRNTLVIAMFTIPVLLPIIL